MSRQTQGVTKIIVTEVTPGRGVIVYRIVRSGEPEDPVFVNSLQSNYELGAEPRHVERTSTAIHMGISAYLSKRAA
jgi:hypothetical protein